MKTILAVSISLSTAGFMLAAALDTGAQQPPPAPVAIESQQQVTTERELIPGAHLMTATEREQYRRRMQAVKSPEEKTAIRAEHVKAMEERARKRGQSVRPETASPPALRAGDPARGAALHNVCFSCHGPERYAAASASARSFLSDAVITASGIEYMPTADAAQRRPETLPKGYPRMAKSRVRSVAGLKQAVARWNDYFNPRLSDQELEDLVAYLNAAYYKF